MFDYLIIRLAAFLALCPTLYGLIYIGDHPGAFGAVCGFMMIVNGGFAFFYLSGLGDRENEGDGDGDGEDEHDPY
jgi:hypothetical protein